MRQFSSHEQYCAPHKKSDTIYMMNEVQSAVVGASASGSFEVAHVQRYMLFEADMVYNCSPKMSGNSAPNGVDLSVGSTTSI